MKSIILLIHHDYGYSLFIFGQIWLNQKGLNFKIVQ